MEQCNCTFGAIVNYFWVRCFVAWRGGQISLRFVHWRLFGEHTHALIINPWYFQLGLCESEFDFNNPDSLALLGWCVGDCCSDMLEDTRLLQSPAEYLSDDGIQFIIRLNDWYFDPKMPKHGKMNKERKTFISAVCLVLDQSRMYEGPP